MKILFFSFSFFFIIFTLPVFAHCPLCSAATGAAVSFTRYLGVDDVIVGLFIGAFLISTSLWMHNFLYKRHGRKNYFPYQALIILLVSVITTLISFHYGGLFSGEPEFLSFLGYNRLLSGMIMGIFLSIMAEFLHNYSKTKNSNKAYFPFQGMIMVVSLIFGGIFILMYMGLVI